MNTRLCQIPLVASCALYMGLVVFNNLADYGSNYQFVQHVLAMDTTFPGNAGMWRAFNSPIVHHVFYASIILWEAATAVLLTLGAARMWAARRAAAGRWHGARSYANAGLTLGLLIWLLAFLTVGGEWFLMWQSSTWNGLTTAGRMFTVMGIILIFINLPEATVTEQP